MTEDAFLRGIAETPDDAALRLVYADWLDDHGQPGRAELVRVCERMRCIPVFGDEYWLLKARRNELRPTCPADWLAATGYDGSRYDPLWRDGWPDGWRERWRFIREFTERWDGIPMGDVSGRLAEVRAEEERLGITFPPGLREYIAYAHDAGTWWRPETLVVHRDSYSLQWIEGQNALSVMLISEGEYRWAIRGVDLPHDDPPLYGYFAPAGEEAGYIPAPESGPDAETLTDFIFGITERCARDAVRFAAQVQDAEWLRDQLDALLPLRIPCSAGWGWEGDGVLIRLTPSHVGNGRELWCCARRGAAQWNVPELLWPYSRSAFYHGGLHFEDPQQPTHADPPLDDIPF